jgi:hypothetical protein
MLTDHGDGTRDLGWLPVAFRVADTSRYQLHGPPVRGGRMSAGELRYLVGRPVDPGRGAVRAPRETVEGRVRRPW